MYLLPLFTCKKHHPLSLTPHLTFTCSLVTQPSGIPPPLLVLSMHFTLSLICHSHLTVFPVYSLCIHVCSSHLLTFLMHFIPLTPCQINLHVSFIPQIVSHLFFSLLCFLFLVFSFFRLSVSFQTSFYRLLAHYLLFPRVSILPSSSVSFVTQHFSPLSLYLIITSSPLPSRLSLPFVSVSSPSFTLYHLTLLTSFSSPLCPSLPLLLSLSFVLYSHSSPPFIMFPQCHPRTTDHFALPTPSSSSSYHYTFSLPFPILFLPYLTLPYTHAPYTGPPFCPTTITTLIPATAISVSLICSLPALPHLS